MRFFKWPKVILFIGILLTLSVHIANGNLGQLLGRTIGASGKSAGRAIVRNADDLGKSLIKNGKASASTLTRNGGKLLQSGKNTAKATYRRLTFNRYKTLRNPPIFDSTKSMVWNFAKLQASKAIDALKKPSFWWNLAINGITAGAPFITAAYRKADSITQETVKEVRADMKSVHEAGYANEMFTPEELEW